MIYFNFPRKIEIREIGKKSASKEINNHAKQEYAVAI
jgi:hypothetical protein